MRLDEQEFNKKLSESKLTEDSRKFIPIFFKDKDMEEERWIGFFSYSGYIDFCDKYSYEDN